MIARVQRLHAPTTLCRRQLVAARGASPISASYSPPDEERHIGQLQQKMGAAYAAGRYDDAKSSGEQCRAIAITHFGAAHPVEALELRCGRNPCGNLRASPLVRQIHVRQVTASVLNNLALMHKSLGETEHAAAMYEEALASPRAVSAVALQSPPLERSHVGI